MDVPAEKLRVLVVDDEPLARNRLEALIARHHALELAAACSDGREAISVLTRSSLDLVFLDVQMPEIDGFAVVEQVGVERMPPVVFVTAFDHYALAAFEVDAVDYLLKPFEDARFDAAVERVLRARRQGELGAAAAALERLLAGRRDGETLERFAVHRRERIDLISVDEVEWIGAEGPYVRLHCADGTHLVRDRLSRLADGLAGRGFVRVHRSTLVRLDRIRTLHPLFRGEFEIELSSGDRVKLSRSYSRAVRRRLGL